MCSVGDCSESSLTNLVQSLVERCLNRVLAFKLTTTGDRAFPVAT